MTPAPIHRLRTVLRANATFSGIGGLTALGASGPIGELLGVGNRLVVAAVGAGLVGFAGVVLAIAALETRRLIGGALIVSVADITWVLATAVTVLVADLEARGVAVLAVVAVVVGGFAVLQLRDRAGATDAGLAPPVRVPAA